MTVIKGVVLQEGKPVNGAYVRLVGPSGDFVNEQRTLEEGTFKFNLAPGTWTLRWKAPGKEEATRDVDLKEGDETDLELQL